MALILLLVSLLYIPAVQRYIKNRVVEYAASRWDMTVGIGELSLKFPVDLSLERVYAGKTNTDTLAYLGRLRLDAGIGRLMWGQIAVDDLQLEDVVLNLRNDTTGMVLKVRTDRFGLQADVVSLREKRVDISRLLCSGGDVFLATGVSREDRDTIKNASSFDWTFVIRQLEIDRVYNDLGGFVAFVCRSWKRNNCRRCCRYGAPAGECRFCEFVGRCLRFDSNGYAECKSGTGGGVSGYCRLMDRRSRPSGIGKFGFFNVGN